MSHCLGSILKTQIQEYTRVSCSYVFVCSTQLCMITVLCHEDIYLYKECGPQEKKTKVIDLVVEQEHYMKQVSYDILFLRVWCCLLQGCL